MVIQDYWKGIIDCWKKKELQIAEKNLAQWEVLQEFKKTGEIGKFFAKYDEYYHMLNKNTYSLNKAEYF